MMFNRNKRSLTLDFRNPESQDILRKLACEADVLVENFRPGTMEKMGCGWDDLHALNPRLIMARISGYGQKTSLADRPCFDGIAQAASGLMDMTGAPDGAPMLSGTFVVDYSTALYACVGILAAIEQRHRTGLGQMVDVSLMSSAVSLLMTAIPEYVVQGNQLTRMGNRDRYTAPANTFQAQDGAWVQIIAGNDALFPRFAAMIGRPELTDDPRFSTLAARMKNVDAIEAIAAGWVAGLPADEIVRRLWRRGHSRGEDRFGQGCGDESLHARSRQYHRRRAPNGRHGADERTDHQACPPDAGGRHAPLLGQHTEEVLAEWLGLTADDLERLAGIGRGVNRNNPNGK